jgi:hypothetical protein
MKNLKKIVAVLLSMTAIASTTAFAATEATYEDGTASLVLAEGDITAAANDQLTVVIVPKAAESINSGNIYYINQGAFGEEFAAILADMKVKDGYDETAEYEVRIGGTKVNGEYDVVRFDIAVEEDEVIIYGDVNNTGVVDAGDATWVLKKVATPSIVTPVEEAGKNIISYGDVNKSGGIDAGDATWVLKKVATPTLKMPIEE